MDLASLMQFKSTDENSEESLTRPAKTGLNSEPFPVPQLEFAGMTEAMFKKAVNIWDFANKFGIEYGLPPFSMVDFSESLLTNSNRGLVKELFGRFLLVLLEHHFKVTENKADFVPIKDTFTVLREYFLISENLWPYLVTKTSLFEEEDSVCSKFNALFSKMVSFDGSEINLLLDILRSLLHLIYLRTDIVRTKQLEVVSKVEESERKAKGLKSELSQFN